MYYRREDYLGVARGFLIDLVDFPVALFLSLSVIGAVWTFVADLEDWGGVLLLLCGAVWFGYFVLPKGSRFRPLGYVIAGAQIRKARPAGVGTIVFRTYRFSGITFLLEEVRRAAP